MRHTLRHPRSTTRLAALLRVLLGVSSSRLTLLPFGLAALVLATTGLGCASRPTEPNLTYQSSALTPVPSSPTSPAARPARALAFDHPAAYFSTESLSPILDRDNRTPVAIVGYEDTISYTYTRFDDRQYYDGSGNGSSGGGRYRGGYGSYLDRQSITQTYTVRQK